MTPRDRLEDSTQHQMPGRVQTSGDIRMVNAVSTNVWDSKSIVTSYQKYPSFGCTFAILIVYLDMSDEEGWRQVVPYQLFQGTSEWTTFA